MHTRVDGHKRASPEPSKPDVSAHSGLTSAGAMALDLQGPDSTEPRQASRVKSSHVVLKGLDPSGGEISSGRI